MGKPSQRKLERRKRKQSRDASRQRGYQRRINAFQSFPDVYYQGSVPPALIQCVKDVVNKLVLDHERFFPAAIVQCYHRAKLEGFLAVQRELRVASRMAGARFLYGGGLSYNEFLFSMAFGIALFSKMPPKVLDSYLPFVDIRIHHGRPQPDTMCVEFRSMAEVKTPGGTGYYSRHQPTVDASGPRRVVAFYRHAAERICQRCVCKWKTYPGQGDAFALLHDCVYFEPWVNSFGELGFSLYDSCEEGFLSDSYAKAIVGSREPGKRYYYRVGYCPAVEYRDFLIGKTLLLPGMRGTPEFIWARKNLTSSESSDLQEAACMFSRQGLEANADLSFVKRFHEAGITQVTTFDHVVFRDGG